MSLFQRIKTPFSEAADEAALPPYARVHPIGDVLRDRREELGLDLVEIGDALRIKPVYLAALEQGRAQDLPGPTYAIGFIRAYAQYIGLDSERILERYKDESGEIRARPDLSLPVPLGARSLPGGAILLVGLILALCGYGTWYYLATGERSRPERVAAIPAELRRIVPDTPATRADPTASPEAAPVAAPRLASGLVPSPDTVLAPGAAAAGSPVPGLVASPAVAAVPPPPTVPPPPIAASAPPVPPAPAAASATPVSAGRDIAASAEASAKPGAGVEIRALADCWIQVRAADDQAIVFSRVLKAGETYHVPRAGLFLRTGNAGALAIAVDGKPTPSIGGLGTLRRNVELDPQALLAGTAVRS